jgi:hypothetical protein
MLSSYYHTSGPLAPINQTPPKPAYFQPLQHAPITFPQETDMCNFAVKALLF